MFKKKNLIPREKIDPKVSTVGFSIFCIKSGLCTTKKYAVKRNIESTLLPMTTKPKLNKEGSENSLKYRIPIKPSTLPNKIVLAIIAGFCRANWIGLYI